MKNKLKNPVFWIGLVSTVLLAAGIDPESLVSWNLLADALLSIIKNPVALVACIVAAYAMFNNNDTKKLDNPFKW